MEQSDADLVTQVRLGDRRAADQLLQRYLRSCRAVALAVTGNEADADDVCQDAFVSAMERIDDCRDPARFGGWLLQIVRNRGRNLLRHRRVREAEPLDEAVPDTRFSTAAAVERSELRERLRAGLALLPRPIVRSCCCTIWRGGSTRILPSCWIFRRGRCDRICTTRDGGCARFWERKTRTHERLRTHRSLAARS